MFLWSALAHLIALTSPGPDTAIVLRQVSLHGRIEGFKASLGIGIGIYIHCILAVNGISLIIATSIITGVPRAFGQALEQTQQGDLNYLILIVLGLLTLLVVALVVFVENAQRKIRERFSLKEMLNQTLEVYEELIERKKHIDN